MNDLLPLFLDNLLPILLAAGAGFLLSRWMKIEPRSLSQVIFYIFSPCLVFHLIVNSQLEAGDILKTMAYASTITFIVGAIALMAGWLMKLERRRMAAVLICSMFLNNGNFGLSFVLFAFGETPLAYATLYFVTMSVLTYTVGVVIASMGTTSFSRAFINLFKIPTIYALVLAFILMQTGWELPLPLARTVELLSRGAIPGMLVLLGLQFQTVRWAGSFRSLALTNVIRLVVAPVLALGLSLMFGLQGAARQANIVQSSMPTAVLTTVLATEFDLDPSFVTAAVFTTTILSPLSLTPLLAFLGA